MDDVEIRNNEDAGRYELLVGGALASIVAYQLVGEDRVVLPHTETSPSFQGRGLAAQVVQAALDDARATGRQVVPACWFVAQYIDDHPDYRPLLATP